MLFFLRNAFLKASKQMIKVRDQRNLLQEKIKVNASFN